MQQLTGLDQLFQTLNSPTTNSVLGALVLFEHPAPGQPVPDAAFMRRRIAERIDYLPPFHRVLIRVPFGLSHPYLAKAQRIDIGAHVRTIRLAAPGSREQLAEEAALLMSANLPPGRPMWDLTVFEGFNGDGVAHLLRIDHTVIDGSSFPPMWDILADTPRDPLVGPSGTPWPEPLFGTPEMLARGLLGLAQQPARLVKVQLDLAAWLARRVPQDHWTTLPALIAKVLPGDISGPLAGLLNHRQRAAGQYEITPLIPTLRVPRTPLNGRLTSRRSVAYASMSLDDARGVGKAFGTTLNNVVVSCAAAALRRVLQDRGALPDKPTIVCCPISLRTGKDKNPWANILFMMFAPLPTHVADPVERLEAVTHNLLVAKTSFDNLPTQVLREGSTLLPEWLYSLPIQAVSRAPNALAQSLWNVVVSNVRGSGEPAQMNGLRVDGYAPLSFMTVGGGMNITLQSHADKIYFGFIGAREQVGDLWPMTDYMQEALAELVAAAKESRERGGIRVAPSPEAPDGPEADSPNQDGQGLTPESAERAAASRERRRTASPRKDRIIKVVS